MINRILSKKIISALKHFPAVAILGVRQSGKTTLSKMIMHSISKECIYVDIENPEDIAMLTDPLSFFKANEEKCIILDESNEKCALSCRNLQKTKYSRASLANGYDMLNADYILITKAGLDKVQEVF